MTKRLSLFFSLLVATQAVPAFAQLPYLVKDIDPGTPSSDPSEMVEWNGKLLFFAESATTGRELWTSDGTTAGTQILKDISPGPSDGINGIGTLVPFGGHVYFAADDGANGREVWRTDGTPAGTVLHADVDPVGSSDPRLGVVADRLWMVATTLATGQELWEIDETSGTVQMLWDFNPGPADGFPKIYLPRPFQNQFLVWADDGVHGSELWKFDGTVGSETLLADTVPGPASSKSTGDFIVAEWNGKGLFSAWSPSVGIEPWVTDGTPSGTHVLKDIRPGPGHSSPSLGYDFQVAVVSAGVLFRAYDDSGLEPWITDGTPAGTVQLMELNGGIATGPFIKDLGNGATTFFAATTPSTGSEIWLTDGTTSGTVVVDLGPGSVSGTYLTNQLFEVVAGRGYFPALEGGAGGAGIELGTTDGTPAGTGLIKDLNPITTNAFGPFIPTDDFLLYIINGVPAYSGGAPETTHFLPLDPSLVNLLIGDDSLRVGNTLFFAGRGGFPSTEGLELWALPIDIDGDGVSNLVDDSNWVTTCTCPVGTAPCGNEDASAGCANSTGLGSRIDGSGTTRLHDDDLVLTVSQLPASKPGLLFMSLTMGSPLPFGDGLRCLNGQLARFAPQSSGPAGTFTYGPGLGASVAATLPPALHFQPGSTVHFQAWHRDPAGPCSSGTNVSSAVSVAFTP